MIVDWFVMEKSHTREGIILISTGCPHGREDVRGFIQAILSDSEVMRVSGWKIFSKVLSPLIARLREKKVVMRYESCGAFGVLSKRMEEIASKIEEKLGVKTKPSFIYSKPSIFDVLLEMKEKGVERIVAVPVNPQFSISTNGAFISAFRNAISELNIESVFVTSFYRNDKFIELMGNVVKETLENNGISFDDNYCRFVFVAHSIPLSNLKEGDPYIEQVEETVRRLTNFLQIEKNWILAWQSKIGPVRWVGPDVKECVKKIAKEGIESIVVIPVSFLVENLETLFDLDIELRKVAEKSGIKKFVRVKTPGEDDRFSDVICKIVEEFLIK